jgi:DNA modification methylase
VVDLFGGSGSTLIACHKLARAARVMELDPVYCDVIVSRWQSYTGARAVRAGDGAAFDDLELRRLAS